MVSPSDSDSTKIPPAKHHKAGRDQRSYSRKDFEDAMQNEDKRISRQSQDRAAQQKDKKTQGSPMSLAKQARSKDAQGKAELTTDTDKVQENEELLGEQEELEGQAQVQAKGAQAKKEQRLPNSPFSLFQKGSVKEKGEADSLEKGPKGGKESGAVGSDFAALNPFGGQSATTASIETSVESKQQSDVAEIQALVDQLVDKLYTVQKGGEMNTVIVLKQPPIFEGSSLVITGYKSAGKEFNITFENLRPDAKALLDNNLQSLRTGLVDKGIVQAIHIITTTTQVEHLPGATGQPPSRDQQQQRGDQQQRQDRQREERHPDDEEG